uniref:Uncharacterized protein n=1 Tax=Planktothrix pseudagardhii TaxID=132604 RepID=A0A9W4D612_9CYAN|nr:hypothetical protein NO713_02590 [Planktothrix pseudagardhii]
MHGSEGEVGVVTLLSTLTIQLSLFDWTRYENPTPLA